MMIKGFKGFDENLQCRGFQYEIGEIYEEDVIPKCCDKGFHFCEYPLDVFYYYVPAKNRFCEVEALGNIDKKSDDTKVSTNKIKIGAELNFEKLTKASIDFIYEHVRKTKCKRSNLQSDWSVASNTGDCSVASNTGEKGISSSLGVNSKAKGLKGTWLVLAEWVIVDGGYEVKEVKTVKVDGKKIKTDTLYQLIDGKFVEVQDDNN